MGRLALGKIPIEILNSTVLKLTGEGSDLVATPPKAGLDFAAIRLERGFMLVSADPITGVSKDIGRYAVKVSANDVATSGNRPQFAESVVLLPERSTTSDVRKIAEQIHSAAKDSGITIVGGHTEVTPRLDHPIVVITVFSLVERFVTSAGALDGDTIMMTKTAGLEGTAELAGLPGLVSGRLGPSVVKKAAGMIEDIDITDEAVAAFRTGSVHGMHDCTEGGVLGAVFEMSLASGLGFELVEAAVPVARATREVCRVLSIDPLRLIGSGSLLLAVERGAEREVQGALRPFARVTAVGTFRKGPKVLRTKSGLNMVVRRAPEDELWRVLSKTPGRSQRPQFLPRYGLPLR